MDLIAATQGNAVLQEALVEEFSDKLNTSAEYTSCARFFAEFEGPRRGIEAIEGLSMKNLPNN